MAATASGRQAWRQLMRNTSRGPASSLSKPQPQQHYQFAFSRQISSKARVSPGRAASQSPSSIFRQQQPFAQRSYSSGSQGGKNTPPRNSQQVKFWPFVVVIALGSGGYVLLVNRRKGKIVLPKQHTLSRGGESGREEERDLAIVDTLWGSIYQVQPTTACPRFLPLILSHSLLSFYFPSLVTINSS